MCGVHVDNFDVPIECREKMQTIGALLRIKSALHPYSKPLRLHVLVEKNNQRRLLPSRRQLIANLSESCQNRAERCRLPELFPSNIVPKSIDCFLSFP